MYPLAELNKYLFNSACGLLFLNPSDSSCIMGAMLLGNLISFCPFRRAVP